MKYKKNKKPQIQPLMLFQFLPFYFHFPPNKEPSGGGGEMPVKEQKACRRHPFIPLFILLPTN